MRIKDYKEEYDRLSLKKNLSGKEALEAVKQSGYALQFVNEQLFEEDKDNFCSKCGNKLTK